MIQAHLKGRLGAFALDAAFSMPGSGITGLFGPSGSGKTTILRCLAGLTRLPESRLNVGSDVWQDKRMFVPPHRRSVGYVFQDARLFTHLNVRDNLLFGLRRAKAMKPDVALDDVVSLLGLEAMLRRTPQTLSGGERQRVAVGRALLCQPRVLLMDEPLAALDRDSKQEILPYLEGLPRALSLPILYVSHDIAEIEQLASHLVLMTKEGGVQAAGPLEQLLTDLTLPLARMENAAALITVTVERYDPAYDLTECRIGDRAFFVPGDLGVAGVQRRLRVKASDVSLTRGEPSETSVLNVLPARILSVEAGKAHQLLVLLGIGPSSETKLLSSVTRKSWDLLKLAMGDGVYAQVKGMALADQ